MNPAPAARLAALCASLLLFACTDPAEDAPAEPETLSEARLWQPPETRRSDHVDQLHGQEVADPYRWLEQSASTPEVADWIERQNAWSAEYFDAIESRDEVSDRLAELWTHSRMQPPEKHSGHWLTSYNDGTLEQPVLYRHEEPDAERSPLFDPNYKSADGSISLHQYSVSPDGRWLAWSRLEAGSDWERVRIRDMETGEDRDERLDWIKYSGLSWTKDNQGFFYSRYPEPEGDALTAANRDHELRYHRLGDDQADDRLVYARPDEPEWRFVTETSKDGRWLVVQVRVGTDRRHRVYLMDLGDGPEPDLDGDMIKLVDEFEAGFHFAGIADDRLVFRTDSDAPLGRVVAIDPDQPDPEDWKTLIAERDHALVDVKPFSDGLAAVYMEDVQSALRLFDESGNETGRVGLPMPGTVRQLSASPDSDEIFFTFESFLFPPTVFRYRAEMDGPEIFHEPDLDFDPDAFETRQVFYESADGTKIPMFLTHSPDLENDGDNPVLLFGYGGFNISIQPSFSPENLVWLENGGVFALANIRGGGEYGRDWHRAGQRENRQVIYDDFIAGAEYLVEQEITRPERLAIHGRSNGGLMVGAVINQRPELFGAAIPAVGVMDMLRFHRFTVGAGWIPEFGDPEDPEDFEFLRAYSPLHNIEPREYPSVLVTTADHDDRVVPAHSFKYAAALQRAQQADRPVLVRIETRAGHGAGAPTRVQIDQATDRLTFLLNEIGNE